MVLFGVLLVDTFLLKTHVTGHQRKQGMSKNFDESERSCREGANQSSGFNYSKAYTHIVNFVFSYFFLLLLFFVILLRSFFFSFTVAHEPKGLPKNISDFFDPPNLLRPKSFRTVRQ